MLVYRRRSIVEAIILQRSKIKVARAQFLTCAHSKVESKVTAERRDFRAVLMGENETDSKVQKSDTSGGQARGISLEELFSHLGEPYRGQGRDQLTNAQKDGFLEPLADVADTPRARVDIRSLNDDKQTRRSISESTFARVQSDVEMLDWIFVGRCSGEEDSYEKILNYMAEKVHRLLRLQ
ncbi:hypothetical protein [Ruegeria atlantica]|nr:hypothetical protein [Ruegeria atlantica]